MPVLSLGNNLNSVSEFCSWVTGASFSEEQDVNSDIKTMTPEIKYVCLRFIECQSSFFRKIGLLLLRPTT